MREFGFTKRWDKLQQREFTTFRFSRKDRDWIVGEVVKVVVRPRQKDRYFLYVAQIIKKESREVIQITDEEAVADGFQDSLEMSSWMVKTHGSDRILRERINKLTIHYVATRINVSKGKPSGQDWVDIAALINDDVYSGIDTPRNGITWEAVFD